MRYFLLTLWCSLLSIQLQAAKAYPLPVTVTQSDGTQLTVTAYGDEALHYYMSSDGVLLWHEGHDFFIAQVNDDGTLSSTHQLAHEKEGRDEQEQFLVKRQDKQKFFNYVAKHRENARRREPIQENGTLFPHIGTPRVVVILAQFADDKFIDEDPKSVFEQYLNAEEIDNSVGNGSVGHNHGSVRRYFKDMSFGQFDPQFDIYGPVTLSQPTAVYGEGENSDRMDLMIPEACQLAAEQGLKFSEYDSNNDGYVDLVYVIYAGYAESITGNPTTCIWPKSSYINTEKIDGKRIHRYGVNAELNAFPGFWENAPFERISGIGLFCHEFSHCMGLPDFYATSSSAQAAENPGMEMWSLLDNGEYANGGYNPTEYTAWEREAFGWFKIDTLMESGNYELKNINEAGGKAFRILNEENPSEYFILQNIQKTGWNSLVYGHGMLVTHVDYDRYAFSLNFNSVNNTIGHPRMTIVPADGDLASWYQVGDKTITSRDYYNSHAGDPFPGSEQIREIPAFNTYTGTMKARISSIEETDGVVSFYFDNGSSGIHDLTIDSEGKDRIHTLNGILLNTEKKHLPKGIYIINHRKVAVY